MTRHDPTETTRMKRRLLGETGFERAAVWSAVGFALTTVVLRSAAVLGAPPVEWVAAGCVVLAAIGVVGSARVGSGVLPCMLLVYGPIAGVSLVTMGNVFTGFSLGEPFAIAVVAAIPVGLIGYLVGRTIGGVGDRNRNPT